MIIELKGRIGENGQIIVDTPTTLLPGDVDIVISYTDDAEAQDEVGWDAQFAATPTLAFDKLIEKGLTDDHNGQADEFDPTIEDD